MFPTVKPLVVTALLPHATDVSAAHEPENTCTLGLAKLAPAALMVTVGLVLCATKRYQTSYFAVPPQPAGVPADSVAFTTVPVVLTQVVEDVNAIAPEQRLFAGCAKECLPVKRTTSSINNILIPDRVWVTNSFIVQVAFIEKDITCSDTCIGSTRYIIQTDVITCQIATALLLRYTNQ